MRRLICRSAGAAGILAALALAACQSDAPRPLGPDVPPPPQLADMGHQCVAAESRFALGRQITPEVLQEARDRTGARSAVSVPQGQIPSPADPLRLILEVDAQGRMVGARCG